MTKVVIIDNDEHLLSSVIGPTGPEHRHLAADVMTDALGRADVSFDDISYVVATGYGRINVPFADRQITELTCHARGVSSFFPDVKTAIDIGGQDAKGMKVKDGRLIDFVMNDKCAAGTGRFLEVLSDALGLRVEELGSIAEGAKAVCEISSTCTIFAKQEVISLISSGKPISDIIAGLCDSIATRVVRMIRRLKVEPEVVLTGGVAKNIGVVKAVGRHLRYDVKVPNEPLISGALGAAILGKEYMLKAIKENKSIPKKKRVLEEPTFYS